METIGIDLHQKRSRYVMVSQDERVISKRTIPSTPAAFRETFGALDASSTRVALEATTHWYWAVDIFEELGMDVHLANPRMIGPGRHPTAGDLGPVWQGGSLNAVCSDAVRRFLCPDGHTTNSNGAL